MKRQPIWIISLLLLLPGVTRTQDLSFDKEPVLCLKGSGPTATVTAVTFSPDGKTLYASGYDKVIHVWKRQGDSFKHTTVLRMPIGPGSEGLINALAVSPDGRWLAAGGSALVRGSASFRQAGMASALTPRVGSMSADMLQDQGTIYLFDTSGKQQPRILRGHRGTLYSMIFAPPSQDKAALLISAARETGQDAKTRKVGHFGRMRLWDVATGKQLAQSPRWQDPERSPPGRPGLAAWRTGKEKKDVAVALAQGRTPLLIWDANGDRLIAAEKQPAGPYNFTALFRPTRSAGTGQLITGDFDEKGGGKGRLHVRPIQGEPTPGKEGPPLFTDTFSVPVALADLPGVDGKSRGLAAVVLFGSNSKQHPNEFHLVAFDGRIRVGESLELWKNTNNWLPCLVASPDGRFLAVGGHPSHRLFVYSVDALLKGKENYQELSSEGMSARKVSFVKQNKRRGLRLTVGRTDVVFDFAGDVERGVGKWEADTPGEVPWKRVAVLDEKSKREVGAFLKGPDKEELRLGREQELGPFAYLPAMGGRKYPILAVVYREQGLSYVGLYAPDADGKMHQFRLLSGHVGRIDDLAFQASGRLLASVANDCRVCVWTLTDVAKSVGTCGRINGLAVGEGLRVVQIDTEALSETNRQAIGKNALQVGDAIEEVSYREKALLIRSVQDYYETLWRLAPGPKQIVLKLKDRAKPVTLSIDQGIEDHKPLFTLYLTRRLQWLAWTPQGPYDASNAAELENRIEWQKNPSKHGESVEAIAAGKYRKEFHREGLLPLLASEANLDQALDKLKRRPVPRPDLNLWLDGLGDVGKQDRNGLIVRRPPEMLRAVVTGPAAWQIAKVEWQRDDEPWRNFTDVVEGEYIQDLSKLTWKRGTYRFRLRVTTSDGVRHPEKSIEVRFKPPAPLVEFDPAWLVKQFGAKRPSVLTVKDSALEMQVRVRPGDSAQAVKAWLIHNGTKTALPSQGKLSRKVTLTSGINLLRVVVHNEGASEDADETRSVELAIRYIDPTPPKLEIVLWSMTPAGEKTIRLLSDREKVTVPVSVVRIRGQVRSNEVLTDVRLGKKPLPGFAKKKEAEINEEVTLSPGKQTLAFTASVGKTTATRKLELTYLPRLPRLDPDSLPAPRLPEGTREYALRLRLTAVDHPHLSASVGVNGGKPVPATLGETNQLLTAKVTLRPGKNVLKFTFDNKVNQADEELHLYVPQPPTITALPAPPNKQPQTVLTAGVASAHLLTGVWLNGREVEKGRLTVKMGKANLWQVQVKDVALTKGENELRLRVSNRDGSEEKSVKVTFNPPQKKAQIRVIAPTGPLVVEKDEVQVHFRVRSESKLREVIVLHDNREVAAGKPTLEDGEQIYRVTVPGLRTGVNRVWVKVSNAAGFTESEKLPVTVVSMWNVRVKFDHMQRRDRSGTTALKLTEKAPVGEMFLHGHVEYRNKDAKLRERVFLSCWVNDFRQVDVELGPAEGQVRRFKLPILLNRESNQVVVHLPAHLKTQGDEHPSVQLACAKPTTEQRLHLLILGPGQDQKQLTATVYKAFGIEEKNGRLANKAFREVIPHRMPANFSNDMLHIKLGSMRVLQRPLEGTSDVVVVFFAGQEHVEERKHYLLTSAVRVRGLEAAVDIGRMREALAGFRGAKLLLLDTQRVKGGERQLPTPNPRQRLGSYHYVWLDNKPAPERGQLLYAIGVAFAKSQLVKGHKDILQGWAKEYEKQAAFYYQLSPALEQLKLR